MRFVRMLTNALTAGLLMTVYVTALILQLNPQVPLASMAALHWTLAVLGVHGLLTTVGVWVALIVRDALSAQPTTPAWLSVRVLAWASALGAGAMAWAGWSNLAGLRAVLDDAAADRLRSGCIAITACAIILAAIAVLRFSFRRRSGTVTGVLLAPTLVASIVLPIGTRGIGDVQVPPVRPPLATSMMDVAVANVPAVHLVLLDGASLSFIRERAAAGKLPNFGRLLDRGAVVPVATLRPTQPEPVWASAMTGKYPPKNGVRSSHIYRASESDADVVNLLPDYVLSQALIGGPAGGPSIGNGWGLTGVSYEIANAGALRARPLWDILADFHVPAGVVRVPLTSPARARAGFIISDQFEDASRSPLRLTDAVHGSPTTAAEIARGAFDDTQMQPWTSVVKADVSAAPASAAIAQLRADRSYAEAMARLNEQFAVDLTAMRYTGIDTMSHLYFGYSDVGRVASFTRNIDPDRQRRFTAALDDYYGWVDGQVGEVIRSLRPGDLLLVVSPFGMDAVSLPRVLVNRLLREPDDSGTHEDAPDGFWLAYGSNVQPALYPRGALVDLTPTILYYMGLPIGRDMDGFARADLFQRAFTIGKPSTFIPTHER